MASVQLTGETFLASWKRDSKLGKRIAARAAVAVLSESFRAIPFPTFETELLDLLLPVKTILLVCNNVQTFSESVPLHSGIGDDGVWFVIRRREYYKYKYK